MFAHLLRRLKSLIRGTKTHSQAIGLGFEWGFIDAVTVERCGLVRVEGWLKAGAHPPAHFMLRADGHDIAASAVYFVYRPDVSGGGAAPDCFRGVVFEYLLPPGRPGLALVLDGRVFAQVGTVTDISRPDYENLLTTDTVLHRDNIYGYGPPSKVISPVVWSLLSGLQGSVLDFGCGIGLLVKQLRDQGVEAAGIEISRPGIIEGIADDLRPYLTLYDGSLPVPYPDAAFDAVVCIEVLEHVPEYETMVAEIARITQHKAIFTVPDMGAIPVCHPHGVVPWHLLEGTHVNFFTQQSLAALMRRYFDATRFFKIHPVTLNGATFFTSIAVVCEKAPAPSRAHVST